VATYQAIAAVSEAVIQLLRASAQAEALSAIELDFKTYVPQDFQSPMQAGLSLFVYRVLHNGQHRLPTGRVSADGRQGKPPLPLEIHFLITVWGKDATLQHTLAGWMMRTLESTPILTPSWLNGVWPGVFRQSETVEIVLGEISTQDVIHLWGNLTERGFNLSVPYIARIIQMEESGKDVQAP
jgi:hypothetical protein